MSALEFAHLYPVGVNPCTLEKNAYSKARATWLCPGCAAPKPGVGPVDLQIQEERPDDEPLAPVSGCGVMLARRDFLQTLGKEQIQADLMLGEVTGPSGKAMSDWSTVRGHRRLIVRGSEHVSYRRCELCGRHVYFAMGERYLFPSPRAGVGIFESDLYGLLIAANVVVPAATSIRWPKLGVEMLKVLDRPKDSLDGLRDETAAT